MLSTQIKELRTQRGMSQEELAEVIGVTQQAVGLWERNKGLPEAKNLIKLADYFKIPLEALLNSEIKPSNPIPKQKPSLTDGEKELIKKYRQLDNGGKKAVENCLDFQYNEMLLNSSPIIEKKTI